MEIRKETKWLCEHARELERFSGKWVMFNVMEDTVKKYESLSLLLKTVHQRGPRDEQSFVFHVPSKRELASPFLARAAKPPRY